MNSISDVDAIDWEQEVTKSPVLTVIYFWHEQCPWCIRFTPILSEIQEEFQGRMRFFKLNVLKNPLNQQIAANYGVMSTPTIIFMCSGRPVGQIVGLVPKDDLERGLEDILSRYRQCMAQSTEFKPSYIV